MLVNRVDSSLCVAHSLRETRAATKHVIVERSKHIEHAAKELPSINKARQIRSEVSSLEERVAEVRKETQRIKAAHDAGTLLSAFCLAQSINLYTNSSS